MSRAVYSPLPLPSLRRTVWAFVRCRTTTPAADFCRPVRMDRSILSPDSRTNGRSPEVSSTAFRTQPPDLQPVLLMDMGFAVSGPLAQHRMPQIRFLYIGSHVCSTLPSDPASRRRPCASLNCGNGEWAKISPHKRRAALTARGGWRIARHSVSRCPMLTSTRSGFRD